MNQTILNTLLWLFIALNAIYCFADDEETLFNRVYLQAKAEREVPNDQMQVMMISEHQGKKPNLIAEQVNKDMAWALDIAKLFKSVQASTKAYRTTPVYKDRLVVAWRANQELQLTSQSIAKLNELVGRLQEKLNVVQMQFMPTEETRTRHENELIEEALVAFKNRVAIIHKHMDEKSYRIVDLHVNTSDRFPSPIRRTERVSMNIMSSAQAPVVEAGSSKVTVTVSGSVQFF